MKSKTNFKQMYLVDASTYNRVNNTTTSTPMILGKSNIKISPPALNVSVSAPVKTDTENLISSNSIYPNTQTTKSVGTLSDVLLTKSAGVMTDSLPTKEHQASQTLHTLPEQILDMNRNGELSDRNLRFKYHPARSSYHSPRGNYRSARNTPYTSQGIYHPSSMEIRTPQLGNDSSNLNQQTTINPQEENTSSTTTLPLQYIVPDTNFQREVMEITTNLPIQHSKTQKLPQTQPQLIEYATNLPIQNSNLPTLPQTQPQLMEYTSNLPTQYSTYPALPQPQSRPQLMDYTTNLPTQYSTYPALAQPQSQPQIMDYTTNLPTQYSNHVALAQPQSQPQHKEYSTNATINHSSHIPLPPSTQDDCEECSVTEYKKYSVDLPFARGLPDNIVFTCTLCESNFDTKKSLQRHMKNIHDAFKQVEKGIKRKSKQGKISVKKVKTTDEVVPYSMYVLKNLT
jgi:hypothetical protein